MSNPETTPRNDEPPVPHGARGPSLIYHPVPYVRIFWYLIILTALTILGSLYRAPNELVNVGIALAIATAKAFLVVRFFMHLKFEGRLIYTIFFVPLSLAVVLAVALIPDIGLGRHTAFNDMTGFFEAMVGQNGQK
ncbi:MAG TPA: cytochrome C oxidase subunit IV family protein [Tepidisphaeraceae bacterium]|jgi:caa(3)-type oxidase subunit IV|nr:cytochrome C oxidase subunit IV family protein [Tepidisphaeraceae bacterium]